MSIRENYNLWSEQYDSDTNLTRDTEAIALREMLSALEFERCLEIGCGTGKNTLWLAEKSKNLLAVDFSEGMISLAKQKVNAKNVKFIIADVNKEWGFIDGKCDLITCSLVLEHIENLDAMFMKVSRFVGDGGYVYIGELHPFRQYLGTKARFENGEGVRTLTCYTHNVSDFINAATKYGFRVLKLNEYFDEGAEVKPPRILSILFQKQK